MFYEISTSLCPYLSSLKCPPIAVLALSTFSPSTLSCLPLLTLSSYYSCPYRASSESVKYTLFPPLGNIYMSNLGASSIPNFSKGTECRLVIIYLTVNIHTKVKTCNIYFLSLEYLTHNDVFLVPYILPENFMISFLTV